jgi:acetyltransferase-like isoleucine patch superfamily enzyme
MPVEQSKIGEGTIIHQPELCNIYYSSIGRDCRIAAFCEIGFCLIGDRVFIQSFAFIPPKVVIDNDVFIGPRVTFCNDKYPPSKGYWQENKVTHVRSRASIGAGAIILPEVTIGEGARIAAGAVITKDVPPGVLSYGAYGKGSSGSETWPVR